MTPSFDNASHEGVPISFGKSKTCWSNILSNYRNIYLRWRHVKFFQFGGSWAGLAAKDREQWTIKTIVEREGKCYHEKEIGVSACWGLVLKYFVQLRFWKFERKIGWVSNTTCSGMQEMEKWGPIFRGVESCTSSSQNMEYGPLQTARQHELLSSIKDSMIAQINFKVYQTYSTIRHNTYIARIFLRNNCSQITNRIKAHLILTYMIVTHLEFHWSPCPKVQRRFLRIKGCQWFTKSG